MSLWTRPDLPCSSAGSGSCVQSQPVDELDTVAADVIVSAAHARRVLMEVARTW